MQRRNQEVKGPGRDTQVVLCYLGGRIVSLGEREALAQEGDG